MIRVEGMIARPCRLTFDDLAALEGQVCDVSKIIAGRDGVAVRLAAIVQHAAVDPEATHLTVIADDDSFSASVPLAAVEDAVLLYKLGEEPLPVSRGGPFRFLVPEAARQRSAEVDACANVKFVAVLRFTRGREDDTRPTTATDHETLHQTPGHEHLDD